MIDFSPDQLIHLARSKYDSGHLEEALAVILRAPKSGEKDGLEHLIQYALGKKLAGEGDFNTSQLHFKACSGPIVAKTVRTPAQQRCSLINAILNGKAESVRAMAGIHSSAKIKDTIRLAGESLQPSIWFVGAAAAYRSGYDFDSYDPLSRLIRRIKHEAEAETLNRLGRLLSDYIFNNTPVLPKADYIVPVPTSPDRWNERGYRIPHALAEAVSKSCAIPVFVDVLDTVGDLPELRNIPRWFRSGAIEGAYKVDRVRGIEGKSLLIIDDIITTGSTVVEIADTLLNAGAAEVAAISLCHTERG